MPLRVRSPAPHGVQGEGHGNLVFKDFVNIKIKDLTPLLRVAILFQPRLSQASYRVIHDRLILER